MQDVLTNRPSVWTLARLVAAVAPLLVASVLPAGATAPAPGGVLPEPVRRAFEAGVLDVRGPTAISTSATQTTWQVPVIMVAFSDLPLTYTPAEFEQELFDTTGATPNGSAAEYWRWVSGGRVLLTGRVVATVVLPHDVAYYGFNYWGLRLTSTPNNIYGAIRDALTACEASVDWSQFDGDHDGYVDMLWFLHAGAGGEALHDYNSMWSITSRFSAGWLSGSPFETSDPVPGSTVQKMRIDRFSTLPEQSALITGRRAEIGVYCHEFGHALGLPDLYDTSTLGGTLNSGPGYWSLMSMGGSGTNGVTPEIPGHLGAWPLKMLGWLTAVRPARDTTIDLAPIETGGAAVEVAFEGESQPEHLLVENRQRLGFDRDLLSEGLVVYHLDEAGIEARYAANRINAGPTPGLKVVEADGRDDLFLGANRGDGSDPFPGDLGVTAIGEDSWPSTATFSGAPTGVALRDIAPVGDAMRFTLQVQAPGWLPARDRTEPGFDPIEVYSPARAAVVGIDGTISMARSEARGGVPQVVLRTRRDGAWDLGQVISASPNSALSPCLAPLPGGDLAMAWSDSRPGGARIYYRARIGGVWTPEQPLSLTPGEAFRPAIAADAHGTVYATWLQLHGTRLDLMFMRFAYTSPFGTPRVVTDTTSTPDDPSITASPDGRVFMLWADRASTPRMFWFASFREDSGLSAPQTLIPRPYRQPGAYSGVLDAAGRLHLVWFESQGSTNEIHYQRREFGTPSFLRDSVIEVRNEYLQSPTLELDPTGSLHLVYESIASGAQQIRYKRWRAGYGWDARSTSVTLPADGFAYRPVVLPLSSGRATVVFTSYVAGAARFIERDRTLDPPPVTAVPHLTAPATLALAAAPNPLRPGAALVLRWTGAADGAPPEVELFDVAGRRLAHAPLAADALGRAAVFAPGLTATWPAGLVFARTRDGRAMARLVVLP